MKKIVKILVFAFVLFTVNAVLAATVPVHDPSIVIVYKDANGNSFPTNDAGATRTKYYYVFGTMLEAAYSTDMLNWTAFRPTFLLNGNISTNYYNIFKEEADYAGHTTNNTVFGNLWASDVIYNKVMQKWCMYYSLSGNEFKSSIILLTADRVEGPYVKQGVVVYGGFTNNLTSAARNDYARVTGSSTVNNRYLRNNGTWNNDYGVSCIDPAVLYDESGKLWMNYGSWSGGIFLLKLDEATGLRDYGYDYGRGANPVWSGNRLRYDPYMGVHLSGGYYVSGEGPYIEYIKDKNGVGYYYLFVSHGFYSPEGGYTMRVFRSATIDGVYRDVTGDDAVFDRYIFNYGNNVQYGFPIMQNYKWDWWTLAQTAQGHNSVLQDEDGRIYLIYHTKFDNGTAWHNVEVHELFFNDKGWPLAAPFEHRKDFGLSNQPIDLKDIVGRYGMIVHNPVDYVNLASNREQPLYLNADGTITGTYTGTWIYNFANGRHFITLTTNAGVFDGVICEQLMDGLSSKTIAFTGMNVANERALWGRKYTNTAIVNTTKYINNSLVIGNASYNLAWDDYDQFYSETINDDFELEFTFENKTLAAENWHNWALTFVNGSETWNLRADAWSNATFTGSTVGYAYNWNWDTEFKNVFANKEVRVKISKTGTTINVFAYVGGSLVYRASSQNSPSGTYTVYLGGEATQLVVKKVAVGQIGNRQLVGTANEDGTYPSAFNTALGQTTAVSGDFELNYNFNNYTNSTNNDNWDNFILRSISTGNPMLLRADAFALEIKGTLNYLYDWDWANFKEIMSSANIALNITRKSNTITYTFLIKARNGQVYNYRVINTGAPTGNMSFGFTCEQSLVDIFSVEKVSIVGGDEVVTNIPTANQPSFEVYSDGQTVYVLSLKETELTVFDITGRKVGSLRIAVGLNQFSDFDSGIYFVNGSKFLIAK